MLFGVSQAEVIAEKLCESVAASLEGKKLASFTRVSSTVQVCELSPTKDVTHLVSFDFCYQG